MHPPPPPLPLPPSPPEPVVVLAKEVTKGPADLGDAVSAVAEGGAMGVGYS